MLEEEIFDSLKTIINIIKYTNNKWYKFEFIISVEELLFWKQLPIITSSVINLLSLPNNYDRVISSYDRQKGQQADQNTLMECEQVKFNVSK